MKKRDAVMRRGRIIGILLVILVMGLLTGCSKGGEANERGLAWYESGEYESAAEAFGEAIAADNTEAEYYRNRAMALIELGNYEQAQTCLDYADELEPDTPEGARARGILLYEQEIYESALLRFEDALSFSDGKVGEVEYDLLYYMADCQMKLELYDQAAATYTRLMEAGNARIENYYLRGVAYLRNGNTGDACLDFNQVVEAGSFEEYWQVYSLLVESGEQKTANQYLSKAVLLSGDTDSDHMWRGEFHYFLGNYDEAIAEFNAVSQSAMDVDAYMMMAHIYQAKGDVNRVKAAFSMAEAKSSGDPYLIYQQTLFWMGIGDYEEAYAQIAEGMALDSDEYRQELHYCRAVCLEYLGRFAEALDAFQEYKELYGATDEINHEIAFLTTRLDGAQE